MFAIAPSIVPPRLGQKLVEHCEGDGIMTYDANGEAVDLFGHLLSKQRRCAERRSNSQEVLPAIKMLIGDWYIDELGVKTREITACD